MVSILLGVWNGGCVCCCCPAQCSGVARALLIPLQCWRLLLSCRALFHCRVRGVWVVDVCLCCSCGGVSSVRSPLVVVVGGAIVDGGVLSWMVGGMVSEGRLCCRPPVECWCPLLCVGVPLVVCPVALLNGGGSVCCVAPCSDWVWHLALCRPPFTLSVPFVSFLFLFCLVLLCLLWVGKCGGGAVPGFLFSFPPFVFSVTACGLGLCHCGIAVMVCVGQKSVWCLLSTHHPCCGAHFSGVCVVMAVCGDSACLVLLHCVVGCGMAVGEGECEGVWSRRLSSSSLPCCWCSG